MWPWGSLHLSNLVLSLFVGIPTGDAKIPPTLRMDTGFLSRELSVVDGKLLTRTIESRVAGPLLSSTAPPSPPVEFYLKLTGGMTLCSQDYQVVGHESRPTANEQRELFTLLPTVAGNPSVTIEFLARAGDHVLRKRIHVTGSIPVEELSVEALPVRGSTRVGGFGQPLYLADRWFLGLEYPAGTNIVQNGRLHLFHSPGKGTFVSPWCVIGVSTTAESSIEDSFFQYLDTLRRPIRPSLQYNSWFDRREKEVSHDVLLATHERFAEKLLRPYGLTFDAFVVDQGYENPQSLWECSAGWPHGFTPLASQLGKEGSRLGLWLPLNGYFLDVAWGEKQGWERAGHRKPCYCIAAPQYRKALKDALERRIRSGNLGYFKHDFNFLLCDREGHGHPVSEVQSREACVDAELELLAFERKLQPDLFLNVTSGIWPSPWWLMHADTLWMGSSDYAHYWETPQQGTRQAEMTFRDARLFRLLRVDRAQVPVSALMTHGLIRGRYEGIHQDETLRDWSDYVVMHFGRGTMLHELYLSPDLMPDDFWEPLGRAIQWGRSNTHTLSHTRWIGGDPAQGEVYGYAHWSEKKGIFCLRNPSPVPKRFPLSSRERPRAMSSPPRWHPLVIYPWRERVSPVSAEDLRSGSWEIEVPPGHVILLELHSELPTWLADIPEGRFEIVTDGKAAGESRAEVLVFNSPTHPRIGQIRDEVRDRRFWTGNLTILGNSNAEPSQLEVVREPARGALARVETRNSTDEPLAKGKIRAVSEGDAWDRVTHAIPSDTDAELKLRILLPPSPFWPQRCRVTAVATTFFPLPLANRNELAPGIRPPDWPMAPDARYLRQDHVVLDRYPLHRSRSTVESLAWTVLGAAPLLVLPWSLMHALRHHRPWARRMAGVIALLLVILAYRATPLGIALARGFSE